MTDQTLAQRLREAANDAESAIDEMDVAPLFREAAAVLESQQARIAALTEQLASEVAGRDPGGAV